MSQSIENTHAEPSVNGAEMSTVQHYMAKIKNHFAGTEMLDAQQAMRELAVLIEPIALHEQKVAEAERRQLLAKCPAQDPTAGALHALRKLLASGGL